MVLPCRPCHQGPHTGHLPNSGPFTDAGRLRGYVCRRDGHCLLRDLLGGGHGQGVDSTTDRYHRSSTGRLLDQLGIGDRHCNHPLLGGTVGRQVPFPGRTSRPGFEGNDLAVGAGGPLFRTDGPAAKRNGVQETFLGAVSHPGYPGNGFHSLGAGGHGLLGSGHRYARGPGGAGCPAVAFGSVATRLVFQGRRSTRNDRFWRLGRPFGTLRLVLPVGRCPDRRPVSGHARSRPVSDREPVGNDGLRDPYGADPTGPL